MAEGSIPVDLFNPGQVFACLGFAEAAELLLGNAEASFDWSKPGDERFILRAAGQTNPFLVVLDFLAAARVRSVAPKGSENDTSKWRVTTEEMPAGSPFPYPDPDSPATLPAVLEGPAEFAGKALFRLTIDYWGDATRRDNAKFWAGAGGYPGAAVVRDGLELVRDRCREVSEDPFSLEAEQSSSFRFDWRRDNIPIDLGFSLNQQAAIAAVGYPLVELLAAIGLTNARPARANRDKLTYRYSVMSARRATAGTTAESQPLLDLSLLRAALGGAKMPFPQRHFCMRLNWPGKENQARAITTVTEEKSA